MASSRIAQMTADEEKEHRMKSTAAPEHFSCCRGQTLVSSPMRFFHQSVRMKKV
jgi:predicted metal-dependent hydrolase